MPGPLLLAQSRAIDFSYGRWWHGDGGAAGLFSATLRRPLAGPFDFGLGVVHVDDGRSADDRTLTGGELTVSVGRRGPGVYLIGGAGLGMRHGDANLDAQWSAGGGVTFEPLSFLQVGLDARYRVEDRGANGFWRLSPSDRRGLVLQGGLAFRFGRPRRARAARPEGRAGTTSPTSSRPLGPSEVSALARDGGASEETAALAAAVVSTAIDVMGTPYQWGGTDQNGFDCSGLIQYAYSEHGIILPRVSRDQIRTGTRVEPRWPNLTPGDILGFSVEGSSRVTHVGLYVGDGQFIHSASGGVKLSSLTSDDPYSRWWQRRFVAARRILN